MNARQEHQQRLQRLADDSPAWLWMSSESGENTFINKPLAEFLGIAHESLGAGWNVYVHPDDAGQVCAGFRECLHTRREYANEFRLRRFDGEYRWVFDLARPSFAPDGKFTGYTGWLIDITEHREAERTAFVNAELLRTQNKALECIAGGTPLPETLDLLLRSIERLAPATMSSILLLDEDGIHMRHAAAPGLPESFIRAVDGEPIGERAGSCGTAAFRREPVIVDDIATDPLWEDYRDVALAHGLRACWSTPIFDERRQVLGTFALYLDHPGSPSEHHWNLIANVTHTAAVAIVRRRETETLRRSEERLRLAIAGGNLGIWERDVKTNRVTCSDELRAMLGLPAGAESEVTLQSALDAIHPGDRARFEAAIRRALADRTVCNEEFRVLLPDGSVRWIAALGSGDFDAAGNPVRVLGVGLDITDRKRAEEEIRRHQSQLVSAQRLAQVGSYEWDLATGQVYRSEELYRIFGAAPEEFEPTLEGYLARLHPEDRNSTRETIEHAFRECIPFAFEERIVRPDGELRILHSRGEWVRDQQGSPIKLVGTCQDVSERKRAEQQLQAANAALQALSARVMSAQEEERARMARELHDDFSQQIAAVSIAISRLKRGIPADNQDLHDQTERIQEKVVLLAESVRRLSHELHPAILQHGGLGTALGTYCEEFRQLTGIRVSLQTAGSFEGVPREVALSVYRVAQEALQNVLKHAKVSEVAVSLERSGDSLSLVLSDRGVGMRMDTGDAPTGLGLISMKERARLVQGVIEIQSQPGQGTTVRLTVPDKPPQSRAAAR